MTSRPAPFRVDAATTADRYCSATPPGPRSRLGGGSTDGPTSSRQLLVHRVAMGRNRPRRVRGGGSSAMIPGQFDYVRPGSLDDVLRILIERQGEAKLLSGGYSLLPLIKLRLAQPELLVDLQAIGGIDTIVERD